MFVWGCRDRWLRGHGCWSKKWFLGAGLALLSPSLRTLSLGRVGTAAETTRGFCRVCHRGGCFGLDIVTPSEAETGGTEKVSWGCSGSSRC